eukprot:6209314-Pleurochrysis_carterae.AAC.1
MVWQSIAHVSLEKSPGTSTCTAAEIWAPALSWISAFTTSLSWALTPSPYFRCNVYSSGNEGPSLRINYDIHVHVGHAVIEVFW